jgi:hypothetical protein
MSTNFLYPNQSVAFVSQPASTLTRDIYVIVTLTHKRQTILFTQMLTSIPQTKASLHQHLISSHPRVREHPGTQGYERGSVLGHRPRPRPQARGARLPQARAVAVGHLRRHGGAAQVESSCDPQRWQTPVFQPFQPSSEKTGFEVCLQNATCTATTWRTTL